MSKKHPSPSARLLLEGIYEEEGQGVKPGKLADAMHAMNEELGLATPYVTLVQNLSPNDQTIDFIPPGEFGVVKSKQLGRYLKPVTVKSKEEAKDG